MTREKIQAKIWLNNLPIPERICTSNPELSQYGFYRKLSNGKYEIISICKKDARDFVEMTSPDFVELLDATLPKTKK